MNALIKSTSAEMLRLRKWSAIWVIVGAWLALSLSFGYVFNYVAYKTGDDNFAGDGASNAQLLSELMPSAIPDVIVSGLPMFGGALAMVVGALVAGNGSAGAPGRPSSPRVRAGSPPPAARGPR